MSDRISIRHRPEFGSRPRQAPEVLQDDEGLVRVRVRERDDLVESIAIQIRDPAFPALQGDGLAVLGAAK